MIIFLQKELYITMSFQNDKNKKQLAYPEGFAVTKSKPKNSNLLTEKCFRSLDAAPFYLLLVLVSVVPTIVSGWDPSTNREVAQRGRLHGQSRV